MAHAVRSICRRGIQMHDVGREYAAHLERKWALWIESVCRCRLGEESDVAVVYLLRSAQYQFCNCGVV